MSSRFQPTRWSLIQETEATEVRLREKAWTEFDHLYRKPLLRFIRRSGWPADRIEDLLQSFLSILVDRNWLTEADPQRGRMRTFLLSRLKRHLNDARKYDQAEKRGGKVEIVSLDKEASQDASDFSAHSKSENNPEAEREFDRAWAQAILDNTLASLQSEADARGKGHIFRLLKSQITGDSEEKLSDAAKELGLSQGAVRMKLQRQREQFRSRLRSEVAETLLPDEALSEEMRYLARVLSD